MTTTFIESSNECRHYFENLPHLSNEPYMLIKGAFKHLISESLIEQLKSESPSFSPIFQSANEEDNDNLRKSSNINLKHPNEDLVKIMKGTTKLMKSMCPDLKDGDYTLISSEPNCRKQAAHTDYEIIESQEGSYSYITFIALMNDTKICVYNNKGEEKELILQCGDLLICREDFIHAGGFYLVYNVRLHGYFDNKKRLKERSNDTTYFVEFDDTEISLRCTPGQYFHYYSARHLNGLRMTEKKRSRKDELREKCARALEARKINRGY